MPPKKSVAHCIKGGKSRSKAKQAAVRKNGLLGGRPPSRKCGPIGAVKVV